MAGFRSPLDAYREDLARAQGRKRLAADDEFWVILATGLRRLAQAPPRSRPAAARRLSVALVTFAEQVNRIGVTARITRSVARTGSRHAVNVAEALRQFPAPGFASALVTHVLAVAADAEESGAVLVAREMLTDLTQLAAHAPAIDRGTILLQLGRIARTLGELDPAVDLLRAAGDLGRLEGVPELVAREAVSQAVIARTRGNYPAARTLFETALGVATELSLSDVVAMAHQELMIVAAESNDLDAALTHGWQAYSSARTQGSREAEVLGNLAQLCAKAGYDAAAVAGFVGALARTTGPRIRLPVLGGLVMCAARLGDGELVADTAQKVAAEASDAFPFETAGALFAVARALHSIGDVPGSEAAAAQAAAIARAHGFYEPTHRLDEAPASPAALAEGGKGVIRSLEAWAGDASSDPLVSISPRD